MRTPIAVVPFALFAGACLTLLSGCSASDSPTSPAASAPAANTQDATTQAAMDPAAGIQLALPSGAPDAGVSAKRRAPEAVGSVASVTVGEDSVQVVFTPDAGYEYYAGTTFDIPFSAATAIDGETAVVLGDLKQGDMINVWTGACRESMPVQCDVQAVTAAH